MTGTPHRLVNAEQLVEPRGFTHAVVARGGRTVFVAGQTGTRKDGSVPEGIVAQFDQAARNVIAALRAAGAEPEHATVVHIYVTDVERYRASLREIGRAWRAHFGKHYPAMAVFGITALFQSEAMVELAVTAVVPEPEG